MRPLFNRSKARLRLWLKAIKKYFKVFIRVLAYEHHFFWKTLQPGRLTLPAFLAFQSIVSSLPDVETFFRENTPEKWKSYLAINDERVKMISILFLISFVLILWVYERQERNKYKAELINAVERGYVPYLNSQLTSRIGRYINKNNKLDGQMRISLFVPVRIFPLIWQIRMVCCDKTITTSELNKLSFNLEEGALGFTLLQMTSAHEVKVIGNNTPEGYSNLRRRNSIIMSSPTSTVAIWAFRQQGSIVGLLAIDTNDENDIYKLQSQKMHSYIFTWLSDREEDLELLWRAKNNV